MAKAGLEQTSRDQLNHYVLIYKEFLQTYKEENGRQFGAGPGHHVPLFSRLSAKVYQIYTEN